MDANLARENLLDHFENPRNKGVLAQADRAHKLANPICGDQVSLTLAITAETISQIMFEGRGCVISQAAASMLTEAVQGMSLTEACAMDGQMVLDMIGVPLSATRVKCALLSLETLKRALGCERTAPPATTG